jgi:hypothetical protein
MNEMTEKLEAPLIEALKKGDVSGDPRMAMISEKIQ